MKHGNDRLQGTLDLLVLKTLAVRGRMHGYGITLHVEQVSGAGKGSEDALRIEEGSLYPALHRMTQSGWLKAEWGASENNRRARYYSITALGRKQLEREEKNWSALTGAVARLLQFES
jgi:PadR family transcriptional regulator PadR